MKTLPGADIDSDHNLLVAEVQTRLKAVKKSLEEETKMEFAKNQEQRKSCKRSNGAKIQSYKWSDRLRRR